MLTFGSFTPAVLVPAWVSGNSSSASSRATTLGLIAGLQNIGGIISSQSFRVQDGPVRQPDLTQKDVANSDVDLQALLDCFGFISSCRLRCCSLSVYVLSEIEQGFGFWEVTVRQRDGEKAGVQICFVMYR